MNDNFDCVEFYLKNNLLKTAWSSIRFQKDDSIEIDGSLYYVYDTRFVVEYIFDNKKSILQKVFIECKKAEDSF